MKEWREYQCEENHFWEFLKDKDDAELPCDAVCACGLESVMVRRVKAHGVVVSIIPMSRELDSVTGRVGLKNLYYLKLESLDDEFIRISGAPLSAEEVMNLAKRFSGLDKRSAERLWGLKKLGGSDGRIEKIAGE